jgi:hypothetical protein
VRKIRVINGREDIKKNKGDLQTKAFKEMTESGPLLFFRRGVFMIYTPFLLFWSIGCSFHNRYVKQIIADLLQNKIDLVLTNGGLIS